jgi:hypothetical protein
MSKATKRRKSAKSKAKSTKKPSTKRKCAKKPEPYTGGGTWHPSGMMPGGRYRGERTHESW